jgi:flagellar hook-associated protein 2
MAGALSVGGLATGLDTKNLIAQLIAAESAPIQRLQARSASISTANNLFQGISGKLTALRSAAKDLTLDANLSPRATRSTDSAIVSATATASAAAGTYSVMVKQLASSSTLRSASGIGASVADFTASDTGAADGQKKLSELNLATAITGGSLTFQIKKAAGVETRSITVDPTKSLQATLKDFQDALGGSSVVEVVNNRLRITADPTISQVVFGAGTDTSNFWSSTGLRTVTGTQSGGAAIQVSGVSNLGVLRPEVALDGSGAVTPGLKTALSTVGGSGSFEINGTTISYQGTDSLNAVLSRINTSSAGVIASYNTLEDRVVLTSRATGSEAIAIKDLTGNFLEASGLYSKSSSSITGTSTVGANAQVIIQGINGNQPIESTNNRFSNIVPGLTFTASKVDDGKYQTVTVELNPQATIDKLKSFVDAYNTVLDSVNFMTAKGAPNAFDADLRALGSQVRTLTTSLAAPDNAAIKSLTDLGIGTTRDDRTRLSMDSDKIRAALENRPEEVATLFRNATSGIANRLSTYLNNVTGSSGILKSRDRTAQARIRSITDQVSDSQRRMTLRQDQLNKQFAAMEKSVSTMKSQQSAFTSQLGSLG